MVIHGDERNFVDDYWDMIGIYLVLVLTSCVYQ